MDLKKIPHPSFFIDTQLTDTIRHFARDAEGLGRLHPQQLSIIYEQKWFNLFVPTSYGGLHLSLPEGLKIEECLAWADGSTGWTVTLCSGANWFIGFLQKAIAEIVFNTNKVCLAGSGRASGIAKIVGEDYEITGNWNYATGTAHATGFTANCMIEKDGEIIKNEDGSPMVSSFIFLREEVTIHENWNCLGMIATSSNGFEIKALRVKKNRRFEIDPNEAILNSPVYQYPFLQFAEATLAVNSSGMAHRYFDLCEALVKERQERKDFNTPLNPLANLLGEAKIQMEGTRELFYHTAQLSWEEYINSKTCSSGTLKKVSKTSRELASKARHLVDELYPYCGLKAANPSTEMNRVWRNLHTVSQHPLLL
ncbi:MAG: acyl-CoA dehydrogenase [Bacteroidota bacterium]|nr:acyl-CoA dehydrogenase [Bacteroidota bacterium]